MVECTCIVFVNPSFGTRSVTSHNTVFLNNKSKKTPNILVFFCVLHESFCFFAIINLLRPTLQLQMMYFIFRDRFSEKAAL